MTKRKTEWQLGDMPGFDPIDMKRRIQAEIRRETEGMTGAEILAYTRRASEEFHEEGKRYRADKRQAALVGVDN